MKKLKMYLDKYGYYKLSLDKPNQGFKFIEKINDFQLEMIDSFLREDSAAISVALDWLEDEKSKDLYGDSCNFIKKNDEISIFYNRYDSEPKDKNHVFKMKIKNFKNMVAQWWKKVLNQKIGPKEITITLHDDGHVIIDTKN